MPKGIVGKWGENLAIRVPHEIALQLGLAEGEPVEISASGMDIVIRRPAARDKARGDARAAAAEIIANGSRARLDGLTIRELRDEGRPG